MASARADPERPRRLASSEPATERLVERTGQVDHVHVVSGALTLGVFAWCALRGELWALLPLAVLALVLALSSRLVGGSGRPERVELVIGLAMLAAIAVAAALTGGPASPLVFTLPVGVAIGATRGMPRMTAVQAAVAAGAFVAVCLLVDPASVLDDPLRAVAVLVGLIAVTLATTRLARAEIAFRRVAVLDPLTGVLNRQTLAARFAELQAQAQLSPAPIALILLDLDDFKGVNDRHGHDAGDAVLRRVAEQVRGCLRRFELVYRIGGEEFLIVLPGLTERQALATAEQLREVIARPPSDGGVRVSASFGVSASADGSLDLETLSRRADEALYEAKRAGRDQVRVSRRLAAVPASGPVYADGVTR